MSSQGQKRDNLGTVFDAGRNGSLVDDRDFLELESEIEAKEAVIAALQQEDGAASNSDPGSGDNPTP